MPDVTLSQIDEKLLRYADHMSPTEISRSLGGTLSPARVAARIKELLKTRDWLSAAEQDEVVTWKMRRLLASLEESYFKGDLASAKIQLDFLKALGDRLEKRRAATEHDLSTYTANVGRQLGHVVDLALGYMRGALRESVDAETWDALVAEAMNVAWVEIQSKQNQLD